MDWTEVGDHCFAGRYQPYDVTVGVIVGSDGLLVIDTRGSVVEGRAIRDDLAKLSSLPVRWVVDTHWHFDHTFGNAAFPDTPIYGHETVPAKLAESSPRILDDMGDTETEIVPPTETFAAVRTIDLGDRHVELVHPGLGHTNGDIVAVVSSANVVYAGDLIEQSGPPAFGEDSFPLDWPATLEVFSGLLTAETAVVPGHGAVVDHAFVLDQRAAIAEVAQTISQLFDSGVREKEALDHPDWPYPIDVLRTAIPRGYAALRAKRSGGRPLPLV